MNASAPGAGRARASTAARLARTTAGVVADVAREVERAYGPALSPSCARVGVDPRRDRAVASDAVTVGDDVTRASGQRDDELIGATVSTPTARARRGARHR